jgi:hypothetical protein
MAVLGAVVAFAIAIAFFWSDKDRAVRLMEIVRRSVVGGPSTPAQLTEPKRVPAQAMKATAENHADPAVKEIPRGPQPPVKPVASVAPASGHSARKSSSLTQHERWYLQIAEAERDYRIRQLSDEIEAAKLTVKSSKTREERDKARKSLADLRDQADEVLSRRMRAPKLPRAMFAVGFVGRLEGGAIRVKRVIDESKMIVELYSGVKENEPMPVIDQDSILNEGHPVLLSGVSTENLVDNARMLLSETLIVSGTYRDSSGTIYRVEPLKVDSERMRAAFDELLKVDEQDPVKREQMARLRTALLASTPQNVEPKWPAQNLAVAKKLIDERHYKAAKRMLQEIIDEAPLTNLSVEATRLLKLLPPDEVKARSYQIP